MPTSEIVAALGAYFILILVLSVLLFVAWWKMFTKAGLIERG